MQDKFYFYIDYRDKYMNDCTVANINADKPMFFIILRSATSQNCENISVSTNVFEPHDPRPAYFSFTISQRFCIDLINSQNDVQKSGFYVFAENFHSSN